MLLGTLYGFDWDSGPGIRVQARGKWLHCLENGMVYPIF